jgi:hypothetical protein
LDCRDTGENADNRLCVYEGCLWDVERLTTFGVVMSGGKAGVFVFGEDVSGDSVVLAAMLALFTCAFPANPIAVRDLQQLPTLYKRGCLRE